MQTTDETTLKEMLTRALGLEEATSEERDTLLREVGDSIFQAVMLRVFKELSDTDRDMVTALFEEANTDPENEAKQERVFAFVKSKIPAYSKMIEEEAKIFMGDYKNAEE